MNTITPIPTEYRGYLFRSRLEARWAVYLDVCGYDWNYELQGYELPTGERYLPDFEIEGIFAEVKPRRDIAAFDKAIRFAKCADPAKYKGFLLLGGTPDLIAYPMIRWSTGIGPDPDAETRQGSDGKTYHSEYLDAALHGLVGDYRPVHVFPGYNKWFAHYFDDPRTLAAVKAARSERFENTNIRDYRAFGVEVDRKEIARLDYIDRCTRLKARIPPQILATPRQKN